MTMPIDRLSAERLIDIGRAIVMSESDSLPKDVVKELIAEIRVLQRERDEVHEMSQRRGLANRKLLVDNQELIEELDRASSLAERAVSVGGRFRFERDRLKERHAKLLETMKYVVGQYECDGPPDCMCAFAYARNALTEDDRLEKEVGGSERNQRG